MKKLLLTGAVVAVLGACAALSDLRNAANAAGASVGPTADDVARVGVQTAQNLGAAAQELQTRCAALKNEEVPVKEEVALGGAVALNWAKRGGRLFAEKVSEPRPRDAELRTAKNAINLYVATVGKNLAAQSPRPALEWTFGVLDSDAFNAYSAPGGYVMVTRGLLAQVENEAQLAGVLAHEIAHVTERHAIGAYKKLRVDECNKQVIANAAAPALNAAGEVFKSMKGTGLDLDQQVALLGKFTDGLVNDLLTRGFDESQEYDADRIAAEMVARAGYDPYEFVAFLGKIPEGPESYGHHPSKGRRQEQLKTFLAQLEKDPLFEGGPSLAEQSKVPLNGELAAAR